MFLPISEGPTSGEVVIDFIETFLTLGKSHLGQPFILSDWQKEVIRDIYRLRDDGRRQHRSYLLGLPRKNGKSQLGAALALYHLIADTADSAPEVYSAAGDRAQARLVFTEAARMVKASPDLSEACTVYRNEIRCNLNGGRYTAVSADAGLQQGLNPSFVVMDEYHVHKNSELYEALTLGSASRNQPLTLTISTAGFDLDSPLGRLYEHGRRVRSGEVDDQTFGMTWYGPPDDAEFDTSDEKLWAECNPAFHEFQNVEEFRSAFIQTPESAFIRYRLNGWTTSESAWLPAGAWANWETDRRLQDGEKVILGFDGAWRGDSTALVACSLDDGHHIEVLGHWEAPIGDPHWRTPVDEVKRTIRDACQRFQVRELAADPYRFEQSLIELAEEGLPVIEYPTNSVARMVPATTGFYESVVEQEISHDGNQALSRHLANAVLKEDARGGRITKENRSSKRRIDLAVAAVIAHHRAIAYREEVSSEAQIFVL